MNAMGACGLQLYNFGQTVSLVFFTDTWKPSSFYDRVKENWERGMHTLVLLDIKVREQSEENMARSVQTFVSGVRGPCQDVEGLGGRDQPGGSD